MRPVDRRPDQIALPWRLTGQGVQRITLTLADGTKRKIDVPAVNGFATDWPPPEGWHVLGDRGARDGVTFG